MREHRNPKEAVRFLERNPDARTEKRAEQFRILEQAIAVLNAKDERRELDRVEERQLQRARRASLDYMLKEVDERHVLRTWFEGGSPPENPSSLIYELRELLWSHPSYESTQGRERIEIIRSPKELTDFRNREMADAEYPDFTGAPRVETTKLYHWMPRGLFAQAERFGLLPGAFTGRSALVFVYASLEPSPVWGDQRRQSNAIHIPDVNRNDFVQVEIDYDPSMEAFMWMEGLVLDEQVNDVVPVTTYLSALLSSEAVSLSRRVTDLLDREGERQQIDTHVYELDETIYSPLAGTTIPYTSPLHPSSWEESEVLLNWVSPDRIREYSPR